MSDVTGTPGLAPEDPEPTTDSDPFDVENLRSLTDPMGALAAPSLVTLSVRKPGRDEFIRVHPDPDYTLDCYLLEYQTPGA